MTACAIILAGGQGKRLGHNQPKQFVEVFGKPILAYTLEKFQESACIDKIEIVYNRQYFKETKAIIKQYNFTKVEKYVEGGPSYFLSCKNALWALEEDLSCNDIVIFHGSSAPLVSLEIIEDAVMLASKHNASAATLESAFSVWNKKSGDINQLEENLGKSDLCENICPAQYSDKSIHRLKTVQVQFPFAYKYGFIMKVYRDAIKKYGENFDMSDVHDKQIVFDAGYSIYHVKGSKLNFKITTQEDLDLFKGYLMLQEKSQKSAGYCIDKNSQKEQDLVSS